MRRVLLICIAYVVVLGALAVAADRVIAQRIFEDPAGLIPAYRSFQEPSVGAKLHDLDEDEGPISALFIGNSRTLFDVQPDVVDPLMAERGVRQRSFNLGMPTVDVRFWPRFLREYYDRPAPKRLYLGLIPRDLDARNVAGKTEMDAFFASPGFDNRDRSGVWRWSEESLDRLFRLHGRFNDVKRVGVQGLLRGDKEARAQIVVSGRGWGRLADGLAPSKAFLAAQERRLAVRSGPMRLQAGAQQLAAMRYLDRWIRARGGCLTLFTTPLLYDRDQWGNVEVRRDFERVMRRFVAANPHVRFLDLGPRAQQGYTVDDFGDGDHLSPQGARKFSRTLASALASEPATC